MDEILKSMAGNALLAPVLIWFMAQYAGLVKQLLDNQREMVKVMAEVRDAIKKCER